VSQISGTAERIRAKFREKAFLVPLSDDFECQGQMSGSHQGQKGAVHSDHPLASTEWKALATNNVTIPSLPGVISAACVLFDKISLSLVCCQCISECSKVILSIRISHCSVVTRLR